MLHIDSCIVSTVFFISDQHMDPELQIIQFDDEWR